MATQVMTLSEYGQMILELANDWDGEEPIVTVGDLTGNNEITKKDGHTKQDVAVGFANEVLGDSPVMTLTDGDVRFYGTVLFERSSLDEETVEKVLEVADE